MKKKEGPQIGILILPTQLFSDHPLLKKDIPTYLVEHPRYFSDFNFHIQKLILHRASMRAFYSTHKKKYSITYIEHKNAKTLFTKIKRDSIEELHMLDPVDELLQQSLKKEAKKAKIDLQFFETPMFLTDTEWIFANMTGKKSYRMHNFYVQQRKRLGILVRNNQPIGGKWSFDDQNRSPLEGDEKIPPSPRGNTNKHVKEAKRYVAKYFKNHIGCDKKYFYPVTTTQARSLLKNFFKLKFKKFGTYQDAIVADRSFLFHSLLSSSLNIGLITPQEVVEKAIAYAKKNTIPINSTEGFIRQIIGWREFVRALYILEQKKQRSSNFFKAQKKLPPAFWQATTNIEPLDNTIERVLTTAYAHHIERLMILGNFMLLKGYKPNDVYKWFMEMFIDSYDWVMVPNVYGMALYADGGLMTTKPYISSSRYILKMSDYSRGAWCDYWDALYWSFIYKHRKKFRKIGRLKIMTSYLNRLAPKTLKLHIQNAQKPFKP